MSKNNDGGPAFPHVSGTGYAHQSGMTLRQYAMIHAPANLGEVLSFIGEDLVGRPSPVADFESLQGKECRDAINRLCSDRGQWHLELDIKLREKWADALIAAGEVVG